MATQSTISVKTKDGIKSIYCHWNGYPHHQMPLLTKSYNTQEQAEALVELGNLSLLAPSIEKPNGHTFDTPVKGFTIAYGRDLGEVKQEAKIYKKMMFVPKQAYNYLWDGSKWDCLEEEEKEAICNHEDVADEGDTQVCMNCGEVLMDLNAKAERKALADAILFVQSKGYTVTKK
jgi:hypothetical protein